VSLVDTLGLDGTDSSHTQLMDQVAGADVLLWVCKANQPARALDITALSSIRQWFAEHPERIPPPIVVVVTHSDRIPPTDTWNPDEWELPFPLTAADNTDQTDPAIVKQCNIGAAVDAVRNALALGPDTAVVPVALPPALPVFNVQGVIDALKLHTERATNAQLNRRRVEHVNTSPSWSSRLGQLNSLLKRTRSRFWPQA
nr:hypothetical protein [Gammaproteobacteria bacterium]